MRKIFKISLLLFVASLFVGSPQARSMLGVSSYSAIKIVDAIYAGMSIGTIAALMMASGGAAGIAVKFFQNMIKRFGYNTAVAW